MSNMAETYRIVAYDVGTEVGLVTYHQKLFNEPKKFKWTEPLIIELSKNSYEFVFNFGAAVFVNVEETVIKNALVAVGPFIENPSSPPSKEEYLLEIDPALKKEKIGFDKVSLLKFDVDTLKILAFVLAKSVTLASAERLADSTLDELESIIDEFKIRGKIKSKKKLIQTVASAAKMRYLLVSNISILDKPSITWESKRLSSFYEMADDMFELKDRLGTVEHKLGTVLDNSNIILEITEARKSMLLEWAIVILIVIEVLLFLYELFL